MNATVCPINPPGHDWEAGLSCRWCDATRTPGEAVLSGLASVRGWSREAARAVLDAYRAEVLNEAADFVGNDDECDCGGCDTCIPRRLADGLRAMAGEKATPVGATATPDFFQPGRTYTDGNGYTAPEVTNVFLVEHVTRHPDRGHRRAIGWMRTGEPGAKWHGDFRDEGEFDGWADVTEAAG